MHDIHNVLCPVDRSDISQRALTVGAAMARWHDARLRVMEVVSVPLPVPAAVGPVMVAGLSFDVRRQLLAELDRFAEPARSFGVPMHFEVEEGDVVSDILDEARTLPADLIVMGTHGRSGFEHFALGSIAEKILRKAKCPVLTVPPGAPARASDGVPFKKIVCAVDFSNASLKGLEYAFSLAQEADAELTVVHVIDWPDEASLPAGLASALDRMRREWEDEKLRQLRQLIPMSSSTWCKPEPVLAVGPPAREILKITASRQADLLIMGVHGRGPIDLAVFGSTTHKVVRESTCPVLTVRGRG